MSSEDFSIERLRRFEPKISLSEENFEELLNDLSNLYPVWIAPLVLLFEGKADNTIDVYGRALADFFTFTSKQPDQVTWHDVVGFKRFLLEDVGNSPKTVESKLGGVSSYFSKLGEPIGPDGEPLVRHNPVDPVDLTDLHEADSQNSNPTSLDDFTAITKEIDRTTEKGSRDWVLLHWIALCGHRRFEVATLTGSDLWKSNSGDWIYSYPKKGHGRKEKVIPDLILKWLREYLQKSGRSLEELYGDEGVFISSASNRKDLCLEDGQEFFPPIDPGTLSWVLKSYAGEAEGVDPDEVTPHGLRHLGAQILERLTNDPREVQKLLDHQTVETTEIYLRGLQEQNYENFDIMSDYLDQERGDDEDAA